MEKNSAKKFKYVKKYQKKLARMFIIIFIDK
jgi:hypothetical protein